MTRNSYHILFFSRNKIDSVSIFAPKANIVFTYIINIMIRLSLILENFINTKHYKVHECK